MHPIRRGRPPPQAYELRSYRHGPGDAALEIWQLPSPSAPHLSAAGRVAGLRGRNLELVEHRVHRRLAAAGIPPAAPATARRWARSWR